MSNVICFPGTQRPTWSYLDGQRDGHFVLYTDERGHKEAFGPFADPSSAREFAANISEQSGAQVDWETFPAAYAPDPRNGEVYATEWLECRYVDGHEKRDLAGFVVVHMSRSGDSAAMYRGFKTLAEAQAAAMKIARERNAVLV